MKGIKAMRIRIFNEEDRLKFAAVLIKNGYRVHQSKSQRPGKKTMDYFLVAEDVAEGKNES